MLAAADLGIGSAHAGVGAHSTRWCTAAAG